MVNHELGGHQGSRKFEKWNKMCKLMVVLPAEGSRPVMKSNAMWDQGLLEVSGGWRRPVGSWLLCLLLVQTEQAITFSLMSLCILFHQKCHMQKDSIWLKLDDR